jgi:transposase
MDYIESTNRGQILFFPESLDEYVSEDNPIRFIDAFVDSRDLEVLGFKHAVLKETGRPPYHPGVLLKLYAYGYLNRIQSSWTNGTLKPSVRKGISLQCGGDLAHRQAGARP